MAAVKVSSYHNYSSERLVHERPLLEESRDGDCLPPPVKKIKEKEEDDDPKEGNTSTSIRSNVCESIVKLDSQERITHARNQYMFSESGKKFLDMRNNVHHVGHCHPKVIQAAVKQMSLLNTNSRFLHDGMPTLAHRLADTFPGDLNCFFFTNSGSEANDLALQIVQQVTGHSELIAVTGGYHGHLQSLRAISYHPLAVVEGHERPDNIHMVSLPDVYRGLYRDVETAGLLYANEVKEIIKNCSEKDKKVAGFISEPILCCGGVIVSPKGYLKSVYDSIHEQGGLCIADEVQTGFGRVGTHFWAFEQHGVIPDIVTIGKPMGNGHPVAAVVTTKQIAERFASTGVEYFNTFGGNPVSMAVATAVLDVIEEDKLQERALSIGSYLMDKLLELQKRFPVIGDVRGTGLMIGVEFIKTDTASNDDPQPDPTLADVILKSLASDFDIFSLIDGMNANVMKIKPPICITYDDVDYFIQSLSAILKTTSC